MSCEESSAQSLQRLALNSRPKTADPKYTSVKRPPGYLPKNAPPSWVNLSLDSKLPMIRGLEEDIVFTTTKVGKSLHQKQVGHFDLTDPNCYVLNTDYNPLHDKNLTRYFSNPVIYSSLVRQRFITTDGQVQCTLKEFNKYRVYLQKLQLYEILKERKLKDERERRERTREGARNSERGMKATLEEVDIIEERQKQFIKKMKKMQSDEKARYLQLRMKSDEQKAHMFRERSQERITTETRHAQAQKMWRDKMQTREKEEYKKKIQTLKKWLKEDIKRMQDMEQMRQEKQKEHERQLIEKWKERYNQQLERLEEEDRFRQQEEQKRTQNIIERERLMQKRRVKQQKVFEKIRSRWKKDKREKYKSNFSKERWQRNSNRPQREFSLPSSWSLYNSLDSVLGSLQKSVHDKKEGKLLHLLLDEEEENQEIKEDMQEKCHVKAETQEDVDSTSGLFESGKGLVQDVMQQATHMHIRGVANNFLGSLMTKAKKEYTKRDELRQEKLSDPELPSIEKMGTNLDPSTVEISRESNTQLSTSHLAKSASDLDETDAQDVSASSTSTTTSASRRYKKATRLIQDVMENATKTARIRRAAGSFVKDIVAKAVQKGQTIAPEEAEVDTVCSHSEPPSPEKTGLPVETEQEEQEGSSITHQTESISTQDRDELLSVSMSSVNHPEAASRQHQAAMELVQNVMEKATHAALRRAACDFVDDIIAKAMERCGSVSGDGDHSPASKELLAIMNASPYSEEPLSRPACPIPDTPHSSVAPTSIFSPSTMSPLSLASSSEETATGMSVRISTRDDIFFRTAGYEIKSLLPVSCHPATPKPSLDYMEPLETISHSETEANLLSVMDSLTQLARDLAQRIIQKAEEAVELGLEDKSLPGQENLDSIVWGLTNMALHEVEQEVLMETQSDCTIAWASRSLVTQILEEVADELQFEVLQRSGVEGSSDVGTGTLVQESTELREVPSIMDLSSWLKEGPGISDLNIDLEKDSVTESRLSLIACGLVREVMREIMKDVGSTSETEERGKMSVDEKFSYSSMSGIVSGLLSDVLREATRREKCVEIQESQMSLAAVELVELIIRETKEKLSKEMEQHARRRAKEDEYISREMLDELPLDLSDSIDSFAAGSLVSETAKFPETSVDSKISFIVNSIVSDVLRRLIDQQTDSGSVAVNTIEKKISITVSQMLTRELQDLKELYFWRHAHYVATAIIKDVLTNVTNEDTINTCVAIVSTVLGSVVKRSCKGNIDSDSVLQPPDKFSTSQISTISSAVINTITEEFTMDVLSKNVSTIVTAIFEQVLVDLRPESCPDMVSLLASTIIKQCLFNDIQSLTSDKVSSMLDAIVKQVYVALQPQITISKLAITAQEMIDKVKDMATLELLKHDSDSCATCTSSKVSLVAGILVERALIDIHQKLSQEISERCFDKKDIHVSAQAQELSFSSEIETYHKDSSSDNVEGIELSEKEEIAVISSGGQADVHKESPFLVESVTNEKEEYQDSIDAYSQSEELQETEIILPKQHPLLKTIKPSTDEEMPPPHPAISSAENQMSEVAANTAAKNKMQINESAAVAETLNPVVRHLGNVYEPSRLALRLNRDIPLRKSRGDLNLAMRRVSESKSVMKVASEWSSIVQDQSSDKKLMHEALPERNENFFNTENSGLERYENQIYFDQSIPDFTYDGREETESISILEIKTNNGGTIREPLDDEHILPPLPNSSKKKLLQDRSKDKDRASRTRKSSKYSTKPSIDPLSLGEKTKYSTTQVLDTNLNSIKPSQTQLTNHGLETEQPTRIGRKLRISTKSKSTTHLPELMVNTILSSSGSKSQFKQTASDEMLQSRHKNLNKSYNETSRRNSQVKTSKLVIRKEVATNYSSDSLSYQKSEYDTDSDLENPSEIQVVITCSPNKANSEEVTEIFGGELTESNPIFQENKTEGQFVNMVVDIKDEDLEFHTSDSFDEEDVEETLHIVESGGAANIDYDRVSESSSSTQNIIEVKSLCGSQTSLYKVFSGALVRTSNSGSNPPKSHNSYIDFDESLHRNTPPPVTGGSPVKFNTNEDI